MIERVNSVRRWCHSRLVAGTSASDSAAAMTIAPSVGCGTYCMRPVAKTRTRVMTPAPTTPVTCEREPACSATAVRDPLVLTGNPWKKPAAMFAAPIPIISWSPAHPLPPPGGERGGGRHRVREGDDGDGHRSEEQGAEVAPRAPSGG